MIRSWYATQSSHRRSRCLASYYCKRHWATKDFFWQRWSGPFFRTFGSCVNRNQHPLFCLDFDSKPSAFVTQNGGHAYIATVMRRLLTGYAVTFNRRHRRHGQLFQNRYKSILCQEDLYLLELVRYIHLNPLRAGIVKQLKELDKYP